MNLKVFLVIGALIVALPVQAHDVAKGSHGGRIVAASDYHVELVAKDGLVDVFLTDAADKPVTPAGFKGVAILVSGGKRFACRWSRQTASSFPGGRRGPFPASQRA